MYLTHVIPTESKHEPPRLTHKLVSLSFIEEILPIKPSGLAFLLTNQSVNIPLIFSQTLNIGKSLHSSKTLLKDSTKFVELVGTFVLVSKVCLH